MSKYADRLIEHINTHPEFIQPVSRKNEMMNNFLLPGLQDLCVSRTSFKWGIPVDFDPKHVVYVWLDALTNYITGIGYDCDGESTEQFKKDWPADLHLIGKDIIRFHTIYWPIFLMALDLPLPKQIFGHPWLLQGDGKMSKSKGNVIYADELVNMFGVDAVRYFVLHEMPFENDGVITWELMVERMNSDLANTLGNLVNRTVSMTNKYFGGSVTDKGVAGDVDADLKAVVDGTPAAVEEKMDKLRVADAITEIFNLFKRCNKYIDETMPWVLAKDEAQKDRLETVLYNLIDSISKGAELLSSFMPDTSEKILAQLNGGNVTDKPEILFQRLDLEEVMKVPRTWYQNYYAQVSPFEKIALNVVNASRNNNREKYAAAVEAFKKQQAACLAFLKKKQPKIGSEQLIKIRNANTRRRRAEYNARIKKEREEQLKKLQEEKSQKNTNK